MREKTSQTTMPSGLYQDTGEAPFGLQVFPLFVLVPPETLAQALVLYALKDLLVPLVDQGDPLRVESADSDTSAVSRIIQASIAAETFTDSETNN
jgi:hypothetical protein